MRSFNKVSTARSQFSQFLPDLGLDWNFAARLSQGFGTGIGRSDEIYGSLSGAIMVVGLRYGGLTPDDSVAKEKTYTMVGELVTKFKALHSPVACTDLLGYNLSDPQQYADAKAHKVAKEKCAAFIRDAVELVKTSSLGFKTVSLLARLFCNNDERISFVRHFVS